METLGPRIGIIARYKERSVLATWKDLCVRADLAFNSMRSYASSSVSLALAFLGKWW